MKDDQHLKDIGAMIKTINDALEKSANSELKNHGTTFAQLRAMDFIHRNKEYRTTQKELEDFLEVSHPTINGILKRLEEKGYIKTQISVKRRMTKSVELTPSGLKEYERTEEARINHENMLSRFLTAEEKNTLLSLLEKVRRGLCEEKGAD